MQLKLSCLVSILGVSQNAECVVINIQIMVTFVPWVNSKLLSAACCHIHLYNCQATMISSMDTMIMETIHGPSCSMETGSNRNGNDTTNNNLWFPNALAVVMGCFQLSIYTTIPPMNQMVPVVKLIDPFSRHIESIPFIIILLSMTTLILACDYSEGLI